jgi:cholesterol oxidase
MTGTTLPDVKDGTSLAFTEEMRGFVSLGATDPHDGEVTGRLHDDRIAFRITITTDDVARFLAEPEHEARADGWVDAANLGGRRPLEGGSFNLFAPGESPDDRVMRYKLRFTDAQGRKLTLSGWKDVHHGPATRLWLDTSTLFVKLLDEEGAVLGAGTMHIQPTDLAKMLTTFRTSDPVALARFGRFFLGQLWEVYGPR